MSDQRQQPDTNHDRELLAEIEGILASERPTEADDHDPASLHAFASHLAASAPQPGDHFRADLLARLQRELYGAAQPTQSHALTRSQADTHTPTDHKGARSHLSTPHDRQSEQPRISGPARLLEPLRPVVGSLRGMRGRRFATAALSLAGTALMVVLLVGMAAMLRLRQVTSSDQTPLATPQVIFAPDQTPEGVSTPQNELEELASLMEPRVTIPLTTTAPIRSIAWSPDGRVLAAAAPNSVLFWDAATGKLLHATNVPEGLEGFDENTPEFGLAWSPDGQNLAVGTLRSSILLVDAGTGQLRSTIPLPTPTWGPNPLPGSGYDPSRDYVHSLAWSPDGALLAAATEQRPVLLFDPASGQLVSTFGEYRFNMIPNSLIWSPDSHHLYLPEEPPYHMARIDVTTGDISRFPAIIDSPDMQLSDLAWMGGGGTIAIVQDKTAVIREPLTGNELQRLDQPGGKGWIDRVAWSHDGRLLASIGDGIQLWNPATGKLLRPLMENTGVFGNLAWSPKAYTLAVSHRDQNLSNKLILYIHRPDPRRPAPTYTPKPACGDWEIVPSPNSGQVNVLHAVAALSRDDAWAVGYTSDNRDPHTDHSMHESADARTLIQHWDGKEWSIIPSPNAGTSNYLRGIAALTPDDVWAVGYFTSTTGLEQTLIQHWNGKEWNIVSSPYYAGLDNRLAGIAAISPNDIWAVGSYGDNYAHDKPAANPARTLTLHWDGSRWEIVPSPSPSLYTNRLYSVAARSPSEVWAVGYQLTDPGTSPDTRQASHLVLRWNGTEWVEEDARVPNLANSQGFLQHTLLDVAVDSAGSVIAVGASGTEDRSIAQALARDPSGGWSALKLPQDTFQPPGVSLLSGVVALTPNDVWAVGADSGTPVIIGYDGSSSYRTMSPSPEGQIAGFFGVASDGAGGAWAVGYYGPHDAHRTLILRYDATRFCGSPTVMPVAPNPSPSIPAPTQESLPMPTAIATYAAAVATAQALCKSWQVVPSPNPDKINLLRSIAAVSPDDIWAVGYKGSGIVDLGAEAQVRQGPDRTLILHWDGKEWKEVASPNVGQGDNYLTGVTALGDNDAWAVGYYFDGWGANPAVSGYDHVGPPRTLTMHWDGKAWKVVPSPDIGNSANRLNAVAATAADDVWAVGTYGEGDYYLGYDSQSFRKTENPDSPPSTLILHWNGNAWTHIPSPNPGPYFNNLRSVAALSKGVAWAVGEQSGDKLGGGGGGGPDSNPLILRWDGSTWNTSPAPMEVLTGLFETILGVTVASPYEAWAVGMGATEGSSESFVLRWNGTAWQPIPAPGPSLGSPNAGLPLHEYPAAIASISPIDVWIAGHHFNTNVQSGASTWTANWSESGWDTVSSPNPSFDAANASGPFKVTDNTLQGIAVLPGGDAWVVGSTGNDPSRTLILHYATSPCPAP